MTKIWATIGAIITAIIGGLFMRNRYVENKNDELEHEIKIKDKQSEIRREQDATVDKVKREEVNRIEELKKPDGRSRADRINGVLNDRNNT